MHRVEELQKRIATDKNARLLGRRLEVLVEGQARGRWYGQTRTNKLVHFADAGSEAGQLVEVEIVGTSPWSLRGDVSHVAAVA